MSDVPRSADSLAVALDASHAPPRQRTVWVAVSIGLLCVVVTELVSRFVIKRPGDVDQVLFAARAMWAGTNPYNLIGPSLAFDWPWPLYYPLTAAVVLTPIAWLPIEIGRLAFVFVSVTLLAFAVLRDGTTRLPLFGSASFFYSLFAAQWSMVLTAAFMMPALAAVFVAKPNLGGVFLVSAPSRRRLLVLVSAVVGTTLVSLVLVPDWPRHWIESVRSAPAFTAPLMHRGGPLLLLALLRWRRTEARMLVGLALVPHNMVLYEGLILFLVPDTFRQSAVLALLSTIAAIIIGLFVPLNPQTAIENYYQGDVMVALLYLPCLIMVLRRPNRARHAKQTGLELQVRVPE